MLEPKDRKEANQNNLTAKQYVNQASLPSSSCPALLAAAARTLHMQMFLKFRIIAQKGKIKEKEKSQHCHLKCTLF